MTHDPGFFLLWPMKLNFSFYDPWPWIFPFMTHDPGFLLLWPITLNISFYDPLPWIFPFMTHYPGFFLSWPKEERKLSISKFIERCGRMGSTNASYLRAPGYKSRACPHDTTESQGFLQSFHKSSEITFPPRPRPLPFSPFLIHCSTINLPLYAIWFDELEASLNK